jgi:hypothetical protein
VASSQQITAKEYTSAGGPYTGTATAGTGAVAVAAGGGGAIITSGAIQW